MADRKKKSSELSTRRPFIPGYGRIGLHKGPEEEGPAKRIVRGALKP
jgi:hypothetical protein